MIYDFMQAEENGKVTATIDKEKLPQVIVEEDEEDEKDEDETDNKKSEEGSPASFKKLVVYDD